MHNSFILQQYVCYTTILNMFRAERCSSSGGQIVLLQPLVSSPAVSSRTVCRWRAQSALYCTALYRGWRYQRLWWYNLSSWGWAAFCSKHVEDRSVTYIGRSPTAYSTAVCRGWRYQRLWWYNLSSWGWAAFCSKHVEDRSVTYILLKNKGIVH